MNSQKQTVYTEEQLKGIAKEIVNLNNELRREPWKLVPYLKQRISHYDGLFYFAAEKRMTAITT